MSNAEMRIVFGGSGRTARGCPPPPSQAGARASRGMDGGRTHIPPAQTPLAPTTAPELMTPTHPAKDGKRSPGSEMGNSG